MSFKNWVRIKWIENCEDRDFDNRPRYTFDEYSKKYKWWLKKLFRIQQKEEQRREKWRDYHGN